MIVRQQDMLSRTLNRIAPIAVCTNNHELGDPRRLRQAQSSGERVIFESKPWSQPSPGTASKIGAPCDRRIAIASESGPEGGGVELMSPRDEVQARATVACDRRLEQLIDRLPRPFRSTIRWLRRPSSFWARMPASVLLTCGGLFGFLPVLGFWMLPIGLALLADDVPALRSLRSRILDWIERRHPRWLMVCRDGHTGYSTGGRHPPDVQWPADQRRQRRHLAGRRSQRRAWLNRIILLNMHRLMRRLSSDTASRRQTKLSTGRIPLGREG
jgi:hypothetical protein